MKFPTEYQNFINYLNSDGSYPDLVIFVRNKNHPNGGTYFSTTLCGGSFQYESTFDNQTKAIKNFIKTEGV